MKRFVQKPICSVVTALLLWLSGIGCVLCCFAGSASSYWLGELSCDEAASGDDGCCKTSPRNSDADSASISKRITQCPLLAKHIEGVIASNHWLPVIRALKSVPALY